MSDDAPKSYNTANSAYVRMSLEKQLPDCPLTDHFVFPTNTTGNSYFWTKTNSFSTDTINIFIQDTLPEEDSGASKIT